MTVNELDAEANRLSERIYAIYDDYVSQYQSFIQENPKHYFRNWFGMGGSSSDDAIHAFFLRDIETAVAQLSQALALLVEKDKSASSAYGYAVVNYMLTSTITHEKTTTEWYKFVAEYYTDTLLPYLSLSDLKRVRDDYEKRTPKRMMFPKQRELFEKMNALLGDSPK